MTKAPFQGLSLTLTLAAVLTLALPAAITAQVVADKDIAALNLDAQTADDAPRGTEPPSLPGLVAKLAVALGVVFGLMTAVLWAARRWLPQAVKGGRGGSIEVLSSRSIGPRKNLLLVRARHKTILLGVTAQSIQFLTDLDDEADAWSHAEQRAGLEMLAGSPPPAAVNEATTSLEAGRR